jgi:hypothetical protein
MTPEAAERWGSLLVWLAPTFLVVAFLVAAWDARR